MADPAVPVGSDTATPSLHPRSVTSKSSPDNVDTWLKSYLDDTTYGMFKAHFLAKGKGRRPNLPPRLISTNRILAQLYYLKKDGNASWETVTMWYSKMFPDVTITMGQFEYQVMKVMEASRRKLSSGADEDLSLFMSSPLDFNVLDIPLILLKIGLTKPVLLSNPDDFLIPEDTTVTNELIYSLELFRARERLTKRFLHLWINRFLSVLSVNVSDSQFQYKLMKLTKTIKNLQRNNSKEELKSLFSQPFLSSASEPSSNTLVNNETDVASCDCKSKIEELKMLIKQLRKETKQQKGELEGKSDLIEALSLEIKLLKEEQCIWRQERSNSFQVNESEALREIKNLKSKNKEIAEELHQVKKGRVYKRCHYLKNRVADLSRTRVSLENELSSERATNSHLQMTIKEQEMQLQADRKLEAKCLMLRKSLRKEQTLKARYKKCLVEEKGLSASLAKDLEERSQFFTRIEGSNRFSDGVRLAYMALQGEANVAAGNVTKVIQIVSRHLFRTELSTKDLPCPTSALNFMSEASILAQHQSTQAILDCNHFTFGTDGTSRQKKHFLEKHIQLDNGKMFFLGFQEIATDDSQTLLEACVATFRNLSEVFCADQHPQNEENTLRDIISKLKCLMSDRASVMKLFDQKMAEFKNSFLGEETSTHFLFCNAHFLLGLSGAVGNAAKDMEANLRSSQPLGRDASAVFSSFRNTPETAINRIVRTTAEILGPRGDEKSGCRQEWLAYMESVGKKSHFSSFRGNRFNNLFMNAAALLRHQDDIRIFLSDYVSHSNLKLESVLLDLKDERIMSFVTAIAFFYELFTEPYWKLMNSVKPYGQFPSYVRQMESTLLLWTQDDFNIQQSMPVFQDFTSSPFIMDFLASSSLILAQVQDNVRCIAKECHDVLKRQLVDFLDGGVFGGEIQEEVQKILNTCPMTNLTGERLFGDLDYDMSRRRNASLHLRSSLTMWKHNRTSKWVQKQSQRMRKKLIDKAIKLGPRWRKRSREEQKSVMEKVKNRIRENKRRKNEKAIKEAERRAGAIDAIINYGGVCTSKEELDEILHKPGALENLRAQVRYRKFCKGENIQVSGNLNTLYNRLLKHVSRQ